MSSAKGPGRASSGQVFSREAESPQPGLLREFVAFLAHNRKWWLLPILLVLLVMGLLIALTATPAGPWIYTVF